MGVANRMNRLVLNASNKSEASVGYGTLYGDLVGGYAPIVDVYKTEVWALGAFINADAGRERIPATTLDRAPTAELRPDQADTDTLPPYETLDAFLRAVNEEPHSLSLALDAGMDPATAADVVRRICRAEFKRRQGVPGPLVQASADWPERRLPILHNFWPDVLPDR